MGDILQVQQNDGFERYLGLNADFGASKQRVFEDVCNKINARLMGWSEQYLSQAGNEVLIKAVAMAMPNFAMSCFKLPINLCKEIEREIIHYWWKGHKEHEGIHWVGWQRLCMMKEAGGMGFRDLRCFNLAMLAKIGWRIIKHPDSLLATTFRDKYFRSSDFMRAVVGCGSSWGWKGIVQGRKILEAGMRWRLGNGHQVHICLDNWVPKPSTFKIYSRHPDMPILVQGLIDNQMKMWNQDLILRCFSCVEAQTILSLPLSRWGCDDKLVWHFTAHGGYTLDVLQLVGEEFSECWESILKKYEKNVNFQEILQVVVFGLWRLWKTRNSAVFEGTVTDPTTMVRSLQAQVQEYRAALMSANPLINELPRLLDRAQSGSASWVKPAHGWVKANCDGAWLQQTQRGGAGWVIRDTYGWLVRARGGGGINRAVWH
ncbi:uncharacterized protein LOC110760860 [Prunus avium]|uniref:Uncharacterized protein LOC110760860 n=1 Tax=Prunus avium TaxID=42229 RepID=A0A6P5SYW2_PRUAV|nr:uncharacterized protein LOC110760860 [Prunus avium]